MEIEWRDIPSLPGYQASSEGEIRGPDKVIRKLQKHSKGYQFLVISYAAHRLVCEAFHGPPFEGAQALHGPDNTKTNIKPNNLRWGTPQDNVDDWKRDHLRVSPKGEDHGRAKLTWEVVRKTRMIFDNNPTKSAYSLWQEVGQPLGIEYQAFYKMLTRKTWKE